MDQDPQIRRILERHLDDLVRPAVLHEKVRFRVYRQLRKELADLGYGWWRRRRAVRKVRLEVRRIRKEPHPAFDITGDAVVEGVVQVLGEILVGALG